MSNVSVQKHLACHDYHMGSCPLPKEKCPYSHIGKSWGICPNKHYCTTPHKFVDCPLFLVNSCPRGNECSYRHAIKTEDPQEEEQKETKIQPKKIVKGLKMEDFRSSLIELNQDLKILKPFLDQKKQKANKNYSSGSLDLCFIIDITGSMSPWINQTIQYVDSTLTTIFDDFPSIDLRVAFSGYRDYCDASNRYTEIQFTRNIKEFSEQIKRVRCSGGGDLAEDVAGGLYNALQFEWQSVAQQAIFIADSPCHGSKYHDSTSDDYPQGDPSGKKIEDLMREFSRKGIDFTAVEISDVTKKMFSIMRTEYGQSMGLKSIKDKSTSNSGKGGEKVNLSSAVHESVKSTITASFSKSGIGSGSGAIALNEEGKLGNAYKLIMENKKFRKSFTKTHSKERKQASLTGRNVLIDQLRETKVLEEEEFDSGDSDYEEKLEKTCKKQYIEAVTQKAEREQIQKKREIEELRSQFPAHYFETIEETKERQGKKKLKERIQKVLYQKGAFDWDNFENFNDYQAVCHSFELVKNYKGNTEINWKNLEVRTFFLGTKVRLSNLVFSEGAMRYAYHAKDLYLKQKMVAKQVKKEEKQKKMGVQDLQKDILTQIVCKYIVKEFNSKLLESERNKVQTDNSTSIPILQFIDCFIYEMTFPYCSSPLFYFEQFIEGNYEKFNNNAGFVSDSTNIYSQLAQTLSHFSWQLSKGYLAVVDLQGNQTGILTDPQIHCLDHESFGDGNLGYEGILRFFATHECNDYCRQLQLINPFDTAVIPMHNSFFSEMNSIGNNRPTEQEPQKEKQQEKDQQNICQLCDFCQETTVISLDKYINAKKSNSRLMCGSCKPLIEKSSFKKPCKACSKIIEFSTYECIKLRRDIPNICDSCNGFQTE